MTTATVNLSAILTDEQHESVFGITSWVVYENDLIRAVREARGGEVYQGTGDTYFPDPAFLTSSEVNEYAEFMYKEAAKSEADFNETLEDITAQVLEATEEVPDDIVQAIWNAIN